jgi:hypothetical protein
VNSYEISISYASFDFFLKKNDFEHKKVEKNGGRILFGDFASHFCLSVIRLNAPSRRIRPGRKSTNAERYHHQP